MFNGRLHPKRATLAGRVLFLWVAALGLAAAAGRAGQTPANTPPPTSKVQAQTVPPPPKVTPNPTPPRVSGERPRTAPTTAPRPQPRRTATTKIAPAAPAKPINRPAPAPVSGNPPGKAPGRVVEAQSPPTTTPSILSTAAGRRDPFKTWGTPGPVSHVAAAAVTGALPAGTRGLVISQLRLEGTVRQEPEKTMIAVVTNYTKRAYFLKVNDTVYNGVVSKITPEAVYFKENTLDASGRVATHEVEVKLGLAPGEGR